MNTISIPISEETIRQLHTGSYVYLSGTIITARDMAHKYICETFITKKNPMSDEDKAVYNKLCEILNGGVIYHCGPVVKQYENGKYSFVSAGPTTSIREEPYEDKIIEHFKLRGIIGKGGMLDKTLAACRKHGAVYFHAIGGAGPLVASSVKSVREVLKLDFGIPEAMWVIEVTNLPVIVTMDSHEKSLHKEIKAKSEKTLKNLL